MRSDRQRRPAWRMVRLLPRSRLSRPPPAALRIHDVRHERERPPGQAAAARLFARMAGIEQGDRGAGARQPDGRHGARGPAPTMAIRIED